MRILVHYPRSVGRIVLRTEDDWDLDLAAAKISSDGSVHEFRVDPQRAFLYFKPLLVQDGGALWAQGSDYLAVRHLRKPREIWPYFRQDVNGSVCELQTIIDEQTGNAFHYRVFHPPGYAENTLKRYPVLYLQDGQNVFFSGDWLHQAERQDWRIGETLTRLAAMNSVDKVIAVGVYPSNRERDYSQPGYRDYARFLAKTLKPQIDREFRTLSGPSDTAIMGSSLGGVASFYAAWQWPHVFGKAACMSAAFGWRDDLVERVGRDEKRDVVFYLDSGWPHDNYEVTRDMRATLAGRGWVEGRDLVYFAFPDAHHNEQSWATRCHIPIQVFFGRRAEPASRGRSRRPTS